MITLNEALSNRFPQSSEWARLALAALDGEFEPNTPVHDISIGWMRRGDAESADHVETLFILTDDRLGLGQTNAGPDDPRWIDLASIDNVDALGSSSAALHTIELRLADDSTVTVGWTPEFSARAVDVLVALNEAAESMPTELTNQASMSAHTGQLEAIPPSNWVEQPVAVAREYTPVVDTDPALASPSAWFSMGPEVDQAPITASVFTVTPEPVFPAPADASPAPVPDPAFVAPAPAFTSPAPAFTSPAPAPEPAFTAPAPEPVAFDATVPFDAPDAFEPAPFESAVPVPEVSSEPAPWTRPGLIWPEPQRGVLYLGGHPAHPRKRKNGTLVFSPAGIDVSGTGFQSWAMTMDWAFVDRVEIQGPDELMFADNLKIDASSTALIVCMVDGTRMFFEIRSKRPPSVRAALAPVLILADGIPAYRAGN